MTGINEIKFYWFSNKGTGNANMNTPSNAVKAPMICKHFLLFICESNVIICGHLASGRVWIVGSLAHGGDAHQSPPEAVTETPIGGATFLREIHQAEDEQS